MGAKLRAFLAAALEPNRVVSPALMQAIALSWIGAAVLVWMTATSVLIPGPLEVARAFGTVWAEDLLHELTVSVGVYLEALVLTTAISLALAYLTVLPAMRPPAAFVAKSRFLGMAGLTFLFTLLTGGGHGLKVAILVFGMTVFMCDAMTRMVAAIPREAFDHARTLRMGEWRVVLEVVILGRRDQAIEIVRQQAAMAWMMLPLVEGLVRSEGGVGAMLLAQTKHFHLAEVFAIQLAILLVGLGQDVLIGQIREVLCPYADLTLERR